MEGTAARRTRLAACGPGRVAWALGGGVLARSGVAARPGASVLGVASWAQSCGAASTRGRAARPGTRVCKAVRSVGWPQGRGAASAGRWARCRGSSARPAVASWGRLEGGGGWRGGEGETLAGYHVGESRIDYWANPREGGYTEFIHGPHGPSHMGLIHIL
jgi:hypothetical protein